MESLVNLESVSYAFAGSGGRKALEKVDLQIQEGDYVLLCGGSGSGKTTLAYIVAGLIPHLLGGNLEGKATVAGVDISLRGPSELLPHVGLVIQNVDAQLFNPSVADEMTFGLQGLGMDEEEIQSRVSAMAHSLGIGHLMERSPQELSGGEKKLVALASIASMPCRLLIVDEPLAHLDEESAKRVRGVLKELNSQGRTLLVMEHRVQGLIEDVSRCVLLDCGHKVYDGPAAGAGEELVKRGLIPVYGERKRRGKRDEETVLEGRGLYHRRDGLLLLKGVDVKVRRGETLAILGPNGAGKTTLIRHFNGLLRPTEGEVYVMGERVGRRDPSEMSGKVGLVFQNPNDQFFRLKVEEEILASPQAKKRCTESRLEEICETMGIRDLLGRSPFKLSEGEKRRVAIASILAMEPEILVLDEPTSGQDGRARMALARTLDDLAQRGQTTVVVTHDMGFAMAVADRILEMRAGKVVSEVLL